MNKNMINEIHDKIKEARKITSMYPGKAYELSNEALNMSIEYDLKTEQGLSLISLALACRASSDINKVLDYSFQALEIFEETKDILGQIKSLNLIGVAYFYNSMFEEALKYLLQVNEMFNGYEDDYMLSCVLNNIGEIYREFFNYDSALEYYNKALNICIRNNFNLNTASILGNIGEISYISGNYDKALEYLNKSYNILTKEKDMISLGEIENKIGKVYYKLNNLSKAEELFFSALKRLDEVNNKYYAIDVLINIAKLNNSQLNKNIFYFERAIQYAENINAKKKLCEIYKYVSDYYEKVNNYKIALEYFKNYSRLNEELMTSNIQNKLEILKIELGHTKEIDKYENVKNRLEKEISIQKTELEKIKKFNEQLEKKAYEDELTGIPNRRYINAYLNKIWEQTKINNEIIALYMIDIDNFKLYNDYWGHSKGDECLVEVAKCIKNIQIRRKDIFGRYGGEEFVYIARNLDYKQAYELGELLRLEVEKLGISYITNNDDKIITISVGGVLGKISNIENTTNLLYIADKKLYNAKNSGRNRTCILNISELYLKNSW